MQIVKTLLVALSAVSAVVAAPTPAEGALMVRAPNYYSGPYTNFPGKNTWKGFEELFQIHKPYMLKTGSTLADVKKIYRAIKDNSGKHGVPAVVILSMMMQESHGHVGAPLTYSPEGIPTGGLMQCYTCPGYPGQHDLTQEQITGMIVGGMKHFKGNMGNWGNTHEPRTIYPALREYNSGNVNPNDLSDGRGATNSYVSDVVQRLGGWAD